MSPWRNNRHVGPPQVGAMHQVRRRWRFNVPALIAAGAIGAALAAELVHVLVTHR